MTQVRKNRSMGKFLLCLLVLISNTEELAVASSLDQEVEVAWKALNNFFSWQKFWYGSIQAEDCYRRLINRKVPMTFYRFGTDPSRASRIRCYFCQTPERKVANVPFVTVRISDSVLQFGVYNSHEAPWLEGTPVVEFIPPYDPQGCRENGVKVWDQIYREEGRPKNVSSKVIRQIVPLQLPKLEDNLQNDVVLKAVQRSMAHFLRRRYGKEGPQAHQSPVPEALARQVQKTAKLRLGRFRDSDPSLLVWYEGDDTIYDLPFLSLEVLLNEELCLNVSRAGSAMGFEQEEATIEKLLKSKLQKNSIPLELPDWSVP